MRKEYAASVRKCFQACLKDVMPQFELRKGEENVAMGDRLYRCVVSSDLILYVYLVIHDNADEFNLDIGHSRNDVFPIEMFFTEPKTTLVAFSTCFRLNELWQEKDPWWVVDESITGPPEDCLDKVNGLVDDAINKLKERALPYFEELIATRGYESPFH